MRCSGALRKWQAHLGVVGEVDGVEVEEEEEAEAEAKGELGGNTGQETHNSWTLVMQQEVNIITYTF